MMLSSIILLPEYSFYDRETQAFMYDEINFDVRKINFSPRREFAI